MNDDKIKDENEFIKEDINPFIESWNNIKYQSIQYRCQVLCDFDEGDKNGDLFLDAAYEYLSSKMPE